MFYKLTFDMERIDTSIADGTNTIYAEESNIDEIEYQGIKKGYFCYAIVNGKKIDDVPSLLFYYSSKASNLENEYLLNSWGWPIIHKKVQATFDETNITGIQYLPIKLIDVVTNEVNENYVVMNILNFIDAYDMEKSKYKYNEKYDLYSFLPHEIILEKEVCSQYDIFRCKQNKMGIYVSQKVKDIIDRHNWIGFEFYPQKTN